MCRNHLSRETVAASSQSQECHSIAGVFERRDRGLLHQTLFRLLIDGWPREAWNEQIDPPDAENPDWDELDDDEQGTAVIVCFTIREGALGPVSKNMTMWR